MQQIYEIGHLYHHTIERYIGNDPYFMVDNYDGWENSPEECGLQQYTLFTNNDTWLENKDQIVKTFDLTNENYLSEDVDDNMLVVRTYEDEDYRIEIPKDLPTFDPVPDISIYRCDMCEAYMTWECDVDDHESQAIEKITEN